MVEIPSGQIELRDDRTNQKWTVVLNSFLLSKFPVTQALHTSHTTENPSNCKALDKPVETVDWREAATCCNQLSEQPGLNPCYKIPTEGEPIPFDSLANGYRLPTE